MQELHRQMYSPLKQRQAAGSQQQLHLQQQLAASRAAVQQKQRAAAAAAAAEPVAASTPTVEASDARPLSRLHEPSVTPLVQAKVDGATQVSWQCYQGWLL